MTYEKWPLADRVFFVENFATMTNQQLADHFGKSNNGMRQMARRFDMHRANGGKLPWPDDGDAVLRKAAENGLGKDEVKALFPESNWTVINFKIELLNLHFSFFNPVPPIDRLAPEDRIPPSSIDSPEFYGWVRKLYVDYGLSCKEIGAIAGTSHVAIWNRVKQMGIECRTTSAPRGTSGIVGRNDYVAEKTADRTKGPVTGYVRKHRLVMEKLLGFELPDDVLVHHIDGKKKQNEDSNLIVMSEPDHMRYHSFVRAEVQEIAALSSVFSLDGFISHAVPDDFIPIVSFEDPGYKVMMALLKHDIPSNFVVCRWVGRNSAECILCMTIAAYAIFRQLEWCRQEKYIYLMDQECIRLDADRNAIPVVRRGKGFDIWLQRMRLEKSMSAKKIAGILGISTSRVNQLLHQAGLPVEKPTQQLFDDDEMRPYLVQKYVVERLPRSRIAKELGCADSTLVRYLVRYGMLEK